MAVPMIKFLVKIASTDQFKIQKLALLAHTFYFFLLSRSDKICKYLSESLISSKNTYFFQFKPRKDTLFRWLSIEGSTSQNQFFMDF